MQVAGRSGLEIVVVLRRALVAAALVSVAIAVLLVPALARAEAPPRHHAPPKITGPLEAGRLLSASEGKWKSATKPSFSYQWELCEPKHGPCSLISRCGRLDLPDQRRTGRQASEGDRDGHHTRRDRVGHLASE